MLRGEAQQALTEAGLVASSSGSSSASAWVFSQSPSSGKLVARGSTVTLQIKTGPLP
jgi:beta-lactam-binding protein with PASTA domain